MIVKGVPSVSNNCSRPWPACYLETAGPSWSPMRDFGGPGSRPSRPRVGTMSGGYAIAICTAPLKGCGHRSSSCTSKPALHTPGARADRNDSLCAIPGPAVLRPPSSQGAQAPPGDGQHRAQQAQPAECPPRAGTLAAGEQLAGTGVECPKNRGPLPQA